MNAIARTVGIIVAISWFASAASAHPVPKDNHDRTIVVRLQKSDAPNQIRVRVEYRLEVDETTVYLNDMKEFRDEINPLDYRNRPMEYYAQFTKIYAPIYADRLIARVNNKPMEEFRCVSRKERLQDDDGKNLGHLRCDFVFEGFLTLDPNQKTIIEFRELNYLLEPGLITLSLVNESGRAIESKIEPDDALRKRAIERPEPGDDDRLRRLVVVIAPDAQTAPIESPPFAKPNPTTNTDDEPFSLFGLVFKSNRGFWLTMLFAFIFGAAHALTPGHGKTLVAAYLVGERGTLWHALYLGLVTTLTHTGVVIAIAAVIEFASAEAQRALKSWIENGLGLIVGLIIVGMGFWLLLQRLAGRADHVHLDGGHHHGPAPEMPTPATRTLGWWGITVLGITGGMIPCWDAIAVLGATVGANKLSFALPAVLVFSAGLAAVLVVIGILVVQVPRLVESRFGSGRFLRALPIVSAILVMLMGFWMCYDGVHGR
jgi:nickel/cobalt transporter (NicO) family protein